MAPRPEDRFASAGELAEALATAATSGPERKQWWQFWK
jgi:hypothetical protein